VSPCARPPLHPVAPFSACCSSPLPHRRSSLSFGFVVGRRSDDRWSVVVFPSEHLSSKPQGLLCGVRFGAWRKPRPISVGADNGCVPNVVFLDGNVVVAALNPFGPDSAPLWKDGQWRRCDNPPKKIPYYHLRPVHFGH
jgi:hypothetical protein